MFSLLCWLPEFKCQYYPWQLLYTVKRRVYWHLSWCKSFFCTRRQRWLMADRNERNLEERRDSTTHYGLLRYKKMIFKLNHGPGLFHCFMYAIRYLIKKKYAIVYLDDVFFFSHRRRSTLNKSVLHWGWCRVPGSPWNWRNLFTDVFDCLDHTFGPETKGVTTKTTDAIRRFTPPTNNSKVGPFFGSCNVYRRIVLGFLPTTALKNAKLRNNEFMYFQLNETKLKW